MSTSTVTETRATGRRGRKFGSVLRRCRAILALLAEERGWTPNALESRLDCSRNAIRRALDHLESTGTIRRRVHRYVASDARRYTVELVPDSDSFGEPAETELEDVDPYLPDLAEIHAACEKIREEWHPHRLNAQERRYRPVVGFDRGYHAQQVGGMSLVSRKAQPERELTSAPRTGGRREALPVDEREKLRRSVRGYVREWKRMRRKAVAS